MKIKPVCPHCRKEIDVRKLKTTDADLVSWGELYVTFCYYPECRKVLGTTVILNRWMPDDEGGHVDS
ncbi:MAG: hypothetical protein KGI60_01920 [Patescibacteria group bacterium]|nr:hypothetical protein [Patescibacteria group bacterium]